MTNEVPTPQERQLKIVRRILLFCFIGIAMPLLIGGGIAYLGLVGRAEPFLFGRGPGFEMLPYLPWLGMLILALFVGSVCLVIYNVIKYRLEKDDDLFL
jgi:hypothetical protein